MNKLCKILMILVIMITVTSAVVFATGGVHDKQYLINYIEDTHSVLNKTDKEDSNGLVFIKAADRENLYKHLENYPLNEPADIDAIIAKLEDAKSLLRKYYNSNDEASMGLNYLNAKEKAQLLALVREAAAIAGLTVELDTMNEVATFRTIADGKAIASANYTNYNDIGVYEKDKPTPPPVDPNDPENPSEPNEPSNPTNPDKPNNKPDNGSNNGGTGSTGSQSTGSTSTGSTSTTSKGKLVYTGNDNAVGTKIIIAIVAVAGIGIVGNKYAK